MKDLIWKKCRLYYLSKGYYIYIQLKRNISLLREAQLVKVQAFTESFSL